MRKAAKSPFGRRRAPCAGVPLALAALLTLALALPPLGGGGPAWSAPQPAGPRGGRAGLLRGGAAAALLTGSAAEAKEKEIPPGYVPGGLFAKKVGEKITTPNGVVYEAIALGTDGSGLRDGPPRSGATLEVRFVGRVNGFDGPIFDSAYLRGQRKPNKADFIEARINVDPGISLGLCEALKLMKVGGKGRAVVPGKLSYSEGKTDYQGDEDGEYKEKVKKDEPLYYEVELVRIIKP